MKFREKIIRVIRTISFNKYGGAWKMKEPETPGIIMADTLSLIEALADRNLDYLHVSQTDFRAVPRRGWKTPECVWKSFRRESEIASR
jgi:hypothetical protein